MAADSGSHVSVETLAKLFDCDVRTIQNLAKDGIVQKAGRGQYQLAASIRGYVKHLRDQASGRRGNHPDIDAITEGALLKREQRKSYELKNAILAASAVRIEDIAPAWARVVRGVRSGVLAIPGKARFALPHLTAHDAEELGRICRDQLEAAALGDEPPAIEGVETDALPAEAAHDPDGGPAMSREGAGKI
jgi:phage terminase Nu1 subunit (DNA packaging protein)